MYVPCLPFYACVQYGQGCNFSPEEGGGQSVIVMSIGIRLHPAVLTLMSLLGRSLSLQVQLGPIEVLVEMLMTYCGL